MNKLKILNLATEDWGGSAIASQYLNDLLIKAGHNSVLVVKRSNSKKENVVALQDWSSKYSVKVILQKISSRIYSKYLQIRVGPLDLKYCFRNVFEHKQHFTAKEILKHSPFNPDIIILHWISNFINSKMIHELQELTKAKLFWIMMDNAPISGGCHYPWDCNGFEFDCSNCPAILTVTKKKLAQINLEHKITNLPPDLALITCSENDYTRALRSSAFKTKRVYELLFPLDENKFKPGNKKEAKSFWGIDPAVKVIFFGSISLSDLRKGGILFLEALHYLQNKIQEDGTGFGDVVLLIAGRKEEYVIPELKIPVRKIGYLSESDLIKAFQAADVFVSPSLEDSGPLMINQSVMCGTPVVSFETGVALDLVITGQTGYRSTLVNAEQLATGIKFILDLGEKEHLIMSENCRNLGLRLCHSQKQIEKLLNILHSN